ncbi:MAG: MlaD family protein [Candidatus Delongbacteria bacterium]|jgi:ABC-type transporter Mla subunit MlaD|nr:MlaD family protein [Candidatus Delongbacteria bacterium]
MKNRTKEAVVGFVSILAITVLIISIIYGKNISLNTEKKVITVLFKTVNGLDIGSKVFVKGVPCGTVKSVDLSNKNVIVKADIDSKINIYTDATATVENKEIMGGKMLVIHVGHSEILLADKPINGKSSKGMNEAISEIADIMTHAKTLIENTDALIVKVTKFIPETDLDQKFDEIANETLSTMKSIKTTMNSVSRKFNITLNKAENLVDTMQVSIDQGKSEIRKVYPQIDSLIFKTDLLITSLNKRVEELTDPKGSIGKLVSSDEFYMKLDRAVTNIDSLVKKIDREGLKTNIDIW